MEMVILPYFYHFLPNTHCYILLLDYNIVSVIWWLSGLMVFYYLEEQEFESYG
jgi:hypothetical protein